MFSYLHAFQNFNEKVVLLVDENFYMFFNFYAVMSFMDELAERAFF